MLGPFDIADRQPVTVAPFLDLVLAWNRGISYGWLAQESDAGRWALVGLSLVVTLGLWLWLAQARRAIAAVALGLVDCHLGFVGGIFAGPDKVLEPRLAASGDNAAERNQHRGPHCRLPDH
jgi:hypothetical protein